MIIKFKTIQDTENSINNKEYISNKYAWLVRNSTVYSMDQVTLEQYLELEGGETLDGLYSWGLEDINEFVDQLETSRINNISIYIAANSRIPEDISMDEVKEFRSKLAQYILESHISNNGDEYDFSCYTDDSNKLIHMLEYYANNMNDCTIHGLNYFINETPITNTQYEPACGCSKSSTKSESGLVAIGNTINSLTKINTGCSCGTQTPDIIMSNNPVMVYRNYIYIYMVGVFGDIKFWTIPHHHDICVYMKQLVDGVIKMELLLTSQSYTDNWNDCTCKTSNSSIQTEYMHILEKLSISLGYIINEEVSGNMNYISESFRNWATLLYENMYWK